ncbi:MAG: hypothetical protein R3C03_11695 [Pirellulaceae bacterium]
MNLRFGIFLVEQGIITCDQFCGLIKIQQQSSPAVSSIALQRNLLSIRQVAQVYEAMQRSDSEDFLATAQQLGMLNAKQSEELSQVQEWTVPSIETLVVDCELMTEPQAQMLLHHFNRMTKAIASQGKSTASSNEVATPEVRTKPPQPKFRSRPIIVQNTPAEF